MRFTEEGFNRGIFVIEGFEDFVGKYLIVEFQNENLIAMTTENPAKAKDKKPQQGMYLWVWLMDVISDLWTVAQ